MNFLLLLTASAIFACIAGSRLSRRLGIPTLFIFIALGMLFGSDGIFKIEFADYHWQSRFVLRLWLSLCFTAALEQSGALPVL